MLFLSICILCFVLFVTFLIYLYVNLDYKHNYQDLKNNHVLITGGSSGIGKAAAIEAVNLGAHVSIIGRDEQKLLKTIAEINVQCKEPNKKIQYAVLDVTTDYQAIEQCLKSLENKLGPIFMLINCAGMCICGQFENMRPEDIKYMVDLNYFGTANPTRCVLPGMKKRNEGLIVFVCSEAALIGIYGYSAYSAGKWAVRGLAEALSMELVGTDVRITLSFPPDTATPGFEQEQLTKPLETKIISGSAGIYSPDVIAKQMIQDALKGKFYSVYTPSGTMLSTLFGGTIDSVKQVLIQIASMSFLRLIMIPVLLSFHKIVRENLNIRQNVNKNK